MASTLYKLACGLALLAGATLVHGQDIQERTIRFGHLNNTDHPTSTGVKKFAELVAAKSGGKIKVQEYPASQLEECRCHNSPSFAVGTARAIANFGPACGETVHLILLWINHDFGHAHGRRVR